MGPFNRGGDRHDTSKSGYDKRAAELAAQLDRGKGLDKYDQEDYNRIAKSGLASSQRILQGKRP